MLWLLVETLLPRPRIPIQRSGDTIHPIVRRGLGLHDVCEWKSGGGDGDIVTRAQLNPR